MAWSYKVTRAENGYVIENTSSDDYEDCGIIVIEDGCSEDGELASMESMLTKIKELFGCYPSKHKRNIMIKIEEENKDEINQK